MIPFEFTISIDTRVVCMDVTVEAIYSPATEGQGSDIEIQCVTMSDEDMAAVGSLFPSMIKWVEKDFRAVIEKRAWDEVVLRGLKKYDRQPDISAGFSKVACGYRY